MSNYEVVIEKEYDTKSDPKLAGVMMVKNEKKRILTTLNSLVKNNKSYVDSMIIYDTGSIDNTKELIIEFCNKYKITIFMIKGEFVNFEVSRNILLEYAETKNADFLLLLDCNDELRGGDTLLKFIKNAPEEKNSFLLYQEWYCGSLNKYYNIRLIRNKRKLKYKGIVHECIYDEKNPIKTPSEICLYQDRTQDDDKTGKRFIKDYEMLYSEFLKKPEDARTLFYLAQTCSCLGKYEESLYYYRLRQEIKNAFIEENFHSALREAELRVQLHHSDEDYIITLLKAAEIFPLRAEPYLLIAKYYRQKHLWFLSFNFAKMACDCPYPSNAILFIDQNIYEYERWHILGIVSYYAGKYEEGRKACLEAIKARDYDIDKSNLTHYGKEEEKAPINEKEQFFSKMRAVLLSQDSTIPSNIINKKIEKLWNLRKNKN